MALWDRNKHPLARLKAREWTNDEDRKTLFRDVTGRSDIKLKDILWTLTASEPEIRQLGAMIMPRFNGPSLANGLLDELKDKPFAQQRLLIRHITRCDASDVQTIATRLLQDSDRGRRALGVELVNALPAQTALVLMKGLLKDPNADVRLAGLNKLLELPSALEDRTLREDLLALAQDSDERIRQAVFKAVLSTPRKDNSLLPILIAGMKDESYNVQQLCAQALGERVRSGDAELETRLIELLSDGSNTVRSAVIKALLQSPNRQRVIRSYLEHTRSMAGWVRERALQSLKSFAEDLIDPIVELMQDPDEEIRLLALVVGGNFEDKRCVQPIIGLLKDKDWWTRATAAETLGRIADPKATPALVGLLKDEEARWTAIEALGNIRDPASVSALLQYATDPAVEIRLAIVNALGGMISQPGVLDALEARARTDESQPVRDRALEQLKAGLAGPKPGRDLQAIAEAGRQHTVEVGTSSLERLLIEVRNKGGSDLHLSVGLPPLFRLHGDLQRQEGEPLTAPDVKEMLESILTETQKALLEQHLQLDLCYTVPNVGRYRANLFVQRIGMGGVFRVIPNLIPTLKDIGMPPHMTDLANYHQGLIVVAGPSGSGKSTTLAALINLFNEQKRAHILTIEDPVEFVHPMKNSLVNQREVGKHTQSFANALRGALREDPDVIVVGEMRDNETMRMALEASETGHLVVATLNTTAAPKTIDRLIESFPPAEQSQVRMALSESLKAIICQNLLPKKDGEGRVALFELLMGTPTARALIRDNKTYQMLSAMQTGKAQGMRTVDMSLQELVQQGVISAETAWLRARDKSIFESLVSDRFLRDALQDPSEGASSSA